MDFLEQAKKLYHKRYIHTSALSANDRDNLGVSITKLVRSSLTQQGGVSSFRYLPFISVIQKTVTGDHFQGDLAAMAFVHLEKYLHLLLAQPWKREFWLLKTYGGFFRTKVKAHLDNPEEILQLVGYMREGESSGNSCLVLDHPPDADIVLNVAFDCQVAAEECIYIEEYHKKMKVIGLSLCDAMQVLLSGSSSDPTPPFPVMAALQGKSNNNSSSSSVACGMFPEAGKQKGAHRGDVKQGFSTGRIVPGSSAAAAVHQVTGVPATHPAPGLGLPPPALAPGFSQQGAYPYQPPMDHHAVGLGLKTDMHQPLVAGGMVGSAGYLQTPGSRVAYASSTGAQSSGYISGSVSSTTPSSSSSSAVYRAPPAFPLSSGYPNSSGSHHHPPPAAPLYNYASRPALNVGDQVDSPLGVAQPPPPPSVSPRHSRQLPLPLPQPQRSPSDFPFIDEDDPGPVRVFPEGTHEQHMQESFLSMQGGDPGRGKHAGGGSMGSEAMRRDHGMGMKDGMVGPFNHWPHSQDVRAEGVVGVAGHPPSSGMVHRSSQPQVSHVVRCPPAPSQPATAVTAMNMALNAASVVEDQQQKGASRYPPVTLVGPAAGAGESPASHNPAYFQDSGLRYRGEPQPHPAHPVYYPPNSAAPLPFQRYSNTPQGPAVPQSKKPPTFAQMAAATGKSPDSRALLARQAQGSSSTATFASQEKGHLPKFTAGSGRSGGGSGSSSEVILREKVAGPVRGSSLVAPGGGGPGQDQGFSRQASQSMDLGMLKWRCRTCTMENSAVETICSACSKSRNAPDLQFPSAGESKRICPACTLENQPGCMTCELCSTPLTDVHTYV